MPRRYRLYRKSDFARLRQHGRRFAHPLVVLIACPQDTTDRLLHANSRFAFSASKRIGNAVHRNRAKRLMREALRPYLAQIKPQWDCMFVARHETGQAHLKEIEAAVLQLLKRAQLLF